PFLMLPGVWLKVSQMDRPRPSSSYAPSIWYDAVAVPQTNPCGNWMMAMMRFLLVVCFQEVFRFLLFAQRRSGVHADLQTSARQPSTTSTSWTPPSPATGMTWPSTGLPSTVMEATPLQTRFGFFTRMRYVSPRNWRVTV